MLTSPAHAPAIASQAVFRSIMDAMARPGEIRPIVPLAGCPAPLTGVSAALALSLLDHETSFWLDPPLAIAADVSRWISFHTGAPAAREPRAAQFAFFADPLQAAPFDGFAQGTAEYPDQSATLVFQVIKFGAGESLTLSGPGIAGARSFSATPLPGDFTARLAANRLLFPRGVDLLLVSDNAVAALPRTTRVSQGVA
jgi:alpha-D-ribose 1-methylphosphonate 5-triphosphate synthase subunit PhnH